MTTFVALGLAYFVAHPRLWRMTLCPVLLTLVVGMTSVVVLLAATLYLQEEALSDVGVPEGLAWVLALMLVFVECFVLTMAYSLICLACYQDKIFEFVLRDQGHEELLAHKRKHATCWRLCTSCCRLSVLLKLGLAVVTVPLNVVPFVGNASYAWLNGKVVAWEYHFFYFELKRYSVEEQEAVLEQRDLQYRLFGMQALLLEMIPGVGAVFMFVNTVGAALFACSIEDEEAAKRAVQEGQEESDPYHSIV